MGLRINTNVASLNAQRNLSQTKMAMDMVIIMQRMIIFTISIPATRLITYLPMVTSRGIVIAMIGTLQPIRALMVL